MDCDLSREQLWSWVDRDAEELEPHLATCPRCRERAEEMREEIDLLAADVAPAEIPVPERIGDYEVEDLIGEGGQALVYAAEQAAPRRRVALKVLKGGRFAGRTRLQRFVRETQTLARLKHPAIATIYETGQTEEGQHYFAMELVDGVPLDAYARSRDLSREAILALLAKVCDAVDYAHRHDVIHRDLKPSNILVDARGEPHILDFGLARITRPDLPLASLVTRPGVVEGTPRYMSPEQAAGDPDEIDARTDVYSLGVIGYELLTGEQAYDVSGLDQDTVRTICELTPRRPSRIRKELRGDLDTILLKALEKDPARRYASAGAMAGDIRRHLTSDPITARPASPLYVLGKAARKRRGWTAAALLALATLVWGAITWLGPPYDEAAARHEALVLKCELFRIEENSRVVQRAETLEGRYPGLPEGPLLRAHALYLHTEPHSIMNRLERALAADSTLWDHRALLAEVYADLGVPEPHPVDVSDARVPDTVAGQMRGLFATLDPRVALDRAHRALELDPDDLSAREAVTRLARTVGEHELSVEVLDELMARVDRPEAWYEHKARQLMILGRYAEAVEVYGAMIDHNPRAAPALTQRANAHRLLGNYEAAVEDLTRAAGIYGRGRMAAWVFYHRGTPHWILGDLEAAEADYAAAGRMLAQTTFADARRYVVLHELGRGDEARAMLAAAQSRLEDDVWLARVFDCLSGELSSADLVAAAATPAQVCEGCYYAGEAARLAGDAGAAADWFRRCRDTGLRLDPAAPCDPMSEHELACWRLAQLD